MDAVTFLQRELDSALRMVDVYRRRRDENPLDTDIRDLYDFAVRQVTTIQSLLMRARELDHGHAYA